MTQMERFAIDKLIEAFCVSIYQNKSGIIIVITIIICSLLPLKLCYF
jgi:hypothetical protein